MHYVIRNPLQKNRFGHRRPAAWPLQTAAARNAPEPQTDIFTPGISRDYDTIDEFNDVDSKAERNAGKLTELSMLCLHYRRFVAKKS